MGKQMTYYMEREVFTQLAQIAVDLGCVILKQNGSKIISGDTSIIDSHCSKYYFYLPAAGEINEELPLGCYNSNAGCVIEASYSTRTKDLCLNAESSTLPAVSPPLTAISSNARRAC